jgi:polyhydroxybutyrate depolymerase
MTSNQTWRSSAIAIVVLALAAAATGACGSDSPAASGGGGDAGDVTQASDGAAGDAGLADGSGDLPTDDVTASDASGADLGSGDDGGAMPDTQSDEGDDAPTEAPATIGGDRPSAVFVPADWATRTDWPLIILLHGYGASGSVQDVYFGLSRRVSSAGFVLLTPDGTVSATGQRFWNATDFCCDFFNTGVDDVGYLTGLIDEAVATLRVDPRRVYLVGHSNGGFMAYRMACDRADRIAGIASLAGSLPSNPDDCQPSRPVSVLDIHGTADVTVLYDGAASTDLLGGYPGAEAVVAWWQGADGCSGDPESPPDADYDTAVADGETERRIWSDCSKGSEVLQWKMQGSGHIPIINNDFRDDLVSTVLAMPAQSP